MGNTETGIGDYQGHKGKFMKSQIHAAVIGDTFSNRSQKASWVYTLLFVKPESIFFGLAAGLYIAARLCGLTDYSLGFDEIFSLTVVRPDWSGLIGLVVHDVVHPPLSYLLLKWERASKTARRSFCSPVWRQ